MKKSKKPQDPEKKNGKKPPLNDYVKYTAIAFQMVAIIALGTWVGYWLDQKYETETPWFTIAIALLSVFAALYLTLKDFIGKD